MTALSVFQFDSAEVRTVIKDDEVWFVATDIAKILGYREAYDMTRLLDDDEASPHIVRTPSSNQHGEFTYEQEVTIISEPGLYRACFRSEKEAAKKLTRWVTHDVLPSIRRQGFYESPAYLELKARAEEASALEARNRRLEDTLGDYNQDDYAAWASSEIESLRVTVGELKHEVYARDEQIHKLKNKPKTALDYKLERWETAEGQKARDNERRLTLLEQDYTNLRKDHDRLKKDIARFIDGPDKNKIKRCGLTEPLQRLLH